MKKPRADCEAEFAAYFTRMYAYRWECGIQK